MIKTLPLVMVVSLLVGCQVTPLHQVDDYPAFFVRYAEDVDAFNNEFALRQHVDRMFHSDDQQRRLTLVASANNQAEYQLAATRVNTLLEHLDRATEVSVFLKPAERAEQHQVIAVYRGQPASAGIQRGLMASDYSEIDGLDGLYDAADERILFTRLLNRELSVSGETFNHQLASVLQQLGWSLEMDVLPYDIKPHAIQRVRLVTLDPVASVSEIHSLLESLLSSFIPTAQFHVSDQYKVVSVWLS